MWHCFFFSVFLLSSFPPWHLDGTAQSVQVAQLACCAVSFAVCACLECVSGRIPVCNYNCSLASSAFILSTGWVDRIGVRTSVHRSELGCAFRFFFQEVNKKRALFLPPLIHLPWMRKRFVFFVLLVSGAKCGIKIAIRSEWIRFQAWK